MNCKMCEELMMKYFDKTATDTENEEFTHHINQCSRCSEKFGQLCSIMDTLEQDIGMEPPDDFELEVMKQVSIFALAQKKMAKQVNFFLMAVTIIILSIPFSMVCSEISNASIYKFFLGLIRYASSISDGLLVLSTVSHFLSSFMHVFGNLINILLWCGIGTIFTMILVSRKRLIDLKVLK